MLFKIGDRVKFLFQNDHGTVTRIVGNGQVIVLNSDDFEVPVYTNELILDPEAAPIQKPEPPKAPESPKATSTTQPVKKETQHTTQSVSDEITVLAAFVPSNGKPFDKCDIDMYLLNDSGYRICYNYIRPSANTEKLETIQGILEPDTKEYVETIAREDLGCLSHIRIQMLFATQKMHKIRQPEEADVRIHTPKFYQETYFQINDFFDEKALIVPIYQNNKLAQAIQELSENGIQGNKDATPTHRQPQQKVKKSDKEVVDLHLFELIEDDKGMTPKEKLDYQMKVFREKLEENIHDPHVRKVIFIHGKGNGRLKMEIRKCLDQNYKRYEYQDASFEEYGGGATLVYVK
jgi:hypothetical protein